MHILKAAGRQVRKKAVIGVMLMAVGLMSGAVVFGFTHRDRFTNGGNSAWPALSAAKVPSGLVSTPPELKREGGGLTATSTGVKPEDGKGTGRNGSNSGTGCPPDHPYILDDLGPRCK